MTTIPTFTSTSDTRYDPCHLSVDRWCVTHSTVDGPSWCADLDCITDPAGDCLTHGARQVAINPPRCTAATPPPTAVADGTC